MIVCSKNFYRTKNPKTQDLIQAAIRWPSDLEGILPILRSQISYLQKGKDLAMYFLGPFCYDRYLRYDTTGISEVSTAFLPPARKVCREEEEDGPVWLWEVLDYNPQHSSFCTKPTG